MIKVYWVGLYSFILFILFCVYIGGNWRVKYEEERVDLERSKDNWWNVVW